MTADPQYVTEVDTADWPSELQVLHARMLDAEADLQEAADTPDCPDAGELVAEADAAFDRWMEARAEADVTTPELEPELGAE